MRDDSISTQKERERERKREREGYRDAEDVVAYSQNIALTEDSKYRYTGHRREREKGSGCY